MNKQKDIFLLSEGNAYFHRNKNKYKTPDPVLDAISALKLKPRSVLEIGCGDGWRLGQLKGSSCFGIDPSLDATNYGTKKYGAHLMRGTAENIAAMSESFDAVIFGFCLYLCDREDLFKIAAEADRVLKDRGYLFIYDFNQESEDVPYKHRDGVVSYKMNYGRMFDWHPSYGLVWQTYPKEGANVLVYRKKHE